MLSQSEWNERLQQRIATIHHALETGQDIDRKLLVLVLANVEVLLDSYMYERKCATTTNVQLTLDEYQAGVLAMVLRDAMASSPPIEYYRIWQRLREVVELTSKPHLDAALLAPYAKQLANNVDTLMAKVIALEFIVKTQAADNTRLKVELETARERLAKTSPTIVVASPPLKLQWQRVPSSRPITCSAKLGEYIAEVWQTEDGTFHAWIRERSDVLRSDSGLASLGIAQAIAEKWLEDLLTKKAREIDALRAAFNKGSTT